MSCYYREFKAHSLVVKLHLGFLPKNIWFRQENMSGSSKTLFGARCEYTRGEWKLLFNTGLRLKFNNPCKLNCKRCSATECSSNQTFSPSPSCWLICCISFQIVSISYVPSIHHHTELVKLVRGQISQNRECHRCMTPSILHCRRNVSREFADNSAPSVSSRQMMVIKHVINPLELRRGSLCC